MASPQQPKIATVDEYIAAFPMEVQELLGQMRRAVREAAPDTEETISYGMPTFRLNGRNLVHFAAFKRQLDSIQPLPAQQRLKKSYLPIRAQRPPCGFPWTSRCL